MVQPILEKMYCISEISVIQAYCPGTAEIPLVAQAVPAEVIVAKLMAEGFTALNTKGVVNIVYLG
jgi:hypothetical protein